MEEYFKAVPHVARIGDGVPSVPMALKPSNERPEDEWISKGIPAYRDTSDAPFAILAKPVAPVRNIKILWHIVFKKESIFWVWSSTFMVEDI